MLKSLLIGLVALLVLATGATAASPKQKVKNVNRLCVWVESGNNTPDTAWDLKIKKAYTANVKTCIVGKQGKTGKQGKQGKTGAKGATGAQGLMGIPGAQGLMGTPGAQGLQGIAALAGRNGLDGVDGDDGLDGDDGVSVIRPSDRLVRTASRRPRVHVRRRCHLRGAPARRASRASGRPGEPGSRASLGAGRAGEPVEPGPGRACRRRAVPASTGLPVRPIQRPRPGLRRLGYGEKQFTVSCP